MRIPGLPAIKASLQDKNATVRQNAVVMVATVGGEGTDFLIKQFQAEKDANARAGFLPSLAHSGHQKLISPLMGMAMKDASPQVRQNAVQLIGYFGQESKEGFEVFAMGLKDSDNQVRINAAHHGNYYGKKCWAPMEDALKSTKDANVRQAIMQNLQFSAYRSKSGVAPLIDCLKDDNTTVRHLACNLLANIGPDAVDALPTLRKLADDGTNAQLQQVARNAVARIEAKK